MKFDPRLDAYRAVCISLVFLMHWLVLDCGWIGVQAFFVLSGFLITGILRGDREVSAPRAYFLNFYARRALRIFPVYFAFLAVLALVANVIRPDILRGLDRALNPSLPYLLTYTENFYRIGTRYTPFFSHLWSLSIEEQFYLVWPLVVFFAPARRLLWISIGAIVAAPLIRWGLLAYQLQQGVDKASAGTMIYFFTGSHIDAFAFGALLTFRHENAQLAATIRTMSRWVPGLFILAGVWMLLLGRLAGYGLSISSFGWPVYLPRFYAYVWGYTLIDALFFVAIANIDKLRWVAEVPALQRLGRVSYGFYLFHSPIVRLAKYFLHDPEYQSGLYDVFCLALTFAFTWGVAELSFRFLEQPLLRLKGLFPRRGDVAGLDAPEGPGGLLRQG